ncbi:MAG: iron-sulfur cluster assembly accessory protein, iron-sulfur cluster assembly protein [Armatimonadetes bacterium CSP1-3]|nr:MAG: iron-sulfur cluster assembly accessory protein, iron-sulfur cluster assembly protein [Armatimonadetes bacterium CSP1-3]
MITVTEQAAAKIRDLFAEQGDAELCLRLSVDKGGCEGYSYGMALDRAPAEDDQVVEAHGVRVLLDPLAARVLAGVQVGYVNSVMGQGFTVSNPNAVSTCGCGHSFKTADDAGAPDPCGDDGRGCS